MRWLVASEAARLVSSIVCLLGHDNQPDVFADDLLALIDRVDEDAVHRGLSERLVPGGDVLAMARTVRLLGRTRQSPDRPGSLMSRASPAGTDRDRAYALAGEHDDRGGEAPRPWEQVAAAHDRLVVLGDPGMGKSWLLRAETHRLAVAAHQKPADDRRAIDGVLVPVPCRAGMAVISPPRACRTDRPIPSCDYVPPAHARSHRRFHPYHEALASS